MDASLHRLQHITATLNWQAVPLGQLDQNKIAKAEFRVEHATLSVSDRLILRKLFQALGLSCKSGEEAARAGEFLRGLGVYPLTDYSMRPGETWIREYVRVEGDTRAGEVLAPWMIQTLAETARTDSDAVARLMLHGRIANVQTSWVKLGVEGTRLMLTGGANDVGGTLMEETISRMAGSQNGSFKTISQLSAMVAPTGRPMRQRTTTYNHPDPERTAAALASDGVCASVRGSRPALPLIGA